MTPRIHSVGHIQRDYTHTQTLIRARVRLIGVRRTDQRIGLDAFGEQINAVLSAGSDTRTPVARVVPFADDPQGSWPAEERTASVPCCRKALFAQPVCPFPPTRPVGLPFPHEGSALRPSGPRFHRPDCATTPSPTSVADVGFSGLPQQCGFAGATVYQSKNSSIRTSSTNKRILRFTEMLAAAYICPSELL